MTIYQEEMQRKAQSYGCTTEYSEEDRLLYIGYKDVYLTSITAEGYMYYTSKDFTDPAAKEIFGRLTDDAETVREYVGIYESAPQMKPKDVHNYRKFSEYGDVVFAGMYSQKHGFMFCSWRQSDNGNYLAHGNYSPDYLASKENFAVRAGLVNKDKLFTTEETTELFKCKEKPQKKKKGRSVQDLMGIKAFTKYGLATTKGELLFYLVSPTNISVLSQVNIEIKIRHLMMVLSAIPDIEITCTDSSECFDDNKSYLQSRLTEENNPKVRRLLKKDMDFLDSIQVEMATARQFLFIARCKGLKPEQVFQNANRIEKIISEQGFEVRRMKKADIKRFLALYFDASMNGEQMPDTDGEQFYEVDDEETED